MPGALGCLFFRDESFSLASLSLSLHAGQKPAVHNGQASCQPHHCHCPVVLL